MRSRQSTVDSYGRTTEELEVRNRMHQERTSSMSTTPAAGARDAGTSPFGSRGSRRPGSPPSPGRWRRSSAAGGGTWRSSTATRCARTSPRGWGSPGRTATSTSAALAMSATSSRGTAWWRSRRPSPPSGEVRDENRRRHRELRRGVREVPPRGPHREGREGPLQEGAGGRDQGLHRGLPPLRGAPPAGGRHRDRPGERRAERGPASRLAWRRTDGRDGPRRPGAGGRRRPAPRGPSPIPAG